jgi:hypothetical protein
MSKFTTTVEPHLKVIRVEYDVTGRVVTTFTYYDDGTFTVRTSYLPKVD